MTATGGSAAEHAGDGARDRVGVHRKMALMRLMPATSTIDGIHDERAFRSRWIFGPTQTGSRMSPWSGTCGNRGDHHLGHAEGQDAQLSQPDERVGDPDGQHDAGSRPAVAIDVPPPPP